MASLTVNIQEGFRTKNGTYRVKIRLIHRRVVKYIPTDFYVGSEDLDGTLNVKKSSSFYSVLCGELESYKEVADFYGAWLEEQNAGEVKTFLMEQKEKGYIRWLNLTRSGDLSAPLPRPVGFPVVADDEYGPQTGKADRNGYVWLTKDFWRFIQRNIALPQAFRVIWAGAVERESIMGIPAVNWNGFLEYLGQTATVAFAGSPALETARRYADSRKQDATNGWAAAMREINTTEPEVAKLPEPAGPAAPVPVRPAVFPLPETVPAGKDKVPENAVPEGQTQNSARPVIVPCHVWEALTASYSTEMLTGALTVEGIVYVPATLWRMITGQFMQGQAVNGIMSAAGAGIVSRTGCSPVSPQNAGNSCSGTTDFHLDFIAFGRQHVRKLKEENRKRSENAICEADKVGNTNYKGYHSMLNSLEKFVREESVNPDDETTLRHIVKCERMDGTKEYLERSDIDVNELTTRLVEKYAQWITTDSARTLYLQKMKALLTKAKDRYNDPETDRIYIRFSPFNRVKVPAAPETKRKSTTAAKIREIITLPDERSCRPYSWYDVNIARDVVAISFLLGGMNLIDLYVCEPFDLVNNRVTYDRQKTRRRRSDHATISFAIPPELRPYIEKYRDKTGGRLFDFYQHYASFAVFQQKINRALKLIADKVGIPRFDMCFYLFRRSWANIAFYHCGVSLDHVDFVLNHRRPEHNLALRYTGKDWEPIDRAVRKVIDYVLYPRPDQSGEAEVPAVKVSEKEARSKLGKLLGLDRRTA